MVNDHLSDFVARVKNGYAAKLTEIRVPHTKAVFQLASVLSECKYVGQITKDANNVVVEMKYVNKKPAIMGISRVSKPGIRKYSSVTNLPKVWGGLGMVVLSTTKGIISGKSAKKLKIGGEIICQVW